MDSGGGESSCRSSSDNCDLRNDREGNLIKFTCFLCGLTENCRYGLVEVSGRTHTYQYKDEMYYMLDPFRNRNVNERRLTRTKTDIDNKPSGSKTANIFDILVLGAICSICGQSVCIDEDCSVFYTKTFCIICVNREKTHFPKSFVEQIDAVRKQRKSERQELKRSF
ncbi:Uncharacterized protein BM_BM10826 [Brugia malayi]|uniref:Cysteine-rich DPF motif domain-containing protein 1 n=1 Tax=Brugia malayi TaxID=6279 RepID=A0A0K0IPN3_BRUMA|nr:Uncharacterized protein BM_BM10826 [Brugia malayi]CRZ25653.1 Bm10826 [Brugia malayi]VIO91648.1 Uncharacterized protein BM_BM10826 [Brugia malayi]